MSAPVELCAPIAGCSGRWADACVDCARLLPAARARCIWILSPAMDAVTGICWDRIATTPHPTTTVPPCL